MRLLLWIASFPYSWIVAWRNRQFDKSVGVQKAEVPVVSIGNLTTGGTGKTPLVSYICQRLRNEHIRVAILSRGYGSDQGSVNDEALELEFRLPDVPHLQDPDRKKIADIAAEELASEILVLDDGFQHRKLHREFDLLVIDATDPFGSGFVLPRGLLREPIENLNRASFVVINRCNLVPAETVNSIKEKVRSISPEIEIAESATVSIESINYQGQTAPLAELKGKRVLAFCGIGNPAGFEKTLGELDIELIEPIRVFPDHHQYSRNDIEEIRNWVRSSDHCQTVLCTHKDLVKINLGQFDGVPLKAILIGNRFLSGEESLWSLLRERTGLDKSAENRINAGPT